MKIPKKILKLLDKREKIAIDLMCVETEIDNWLIAHGANLTDYD